MQISWTRLPFPARNRKEFSRGLTDWLGRTFYETLPAHGYELREEQIYTTFQIARAFAEGQTLFAEAGAGTGKTFAHLLPAVCLARFQGKPALIAVSTPVLQAQLMNPQGDIRTLSRILNLDIDVRLASDPGEYLCSRKADRLFADRPKGWKPLYSWSRTTVAGARSEVPTIPDELWVQAGWDPSLPCDTCRLRGTCHVVAARRHYRGAGDLVVTDHRLLALDLLTRAERTASGQLPLLPPCSAVVLDEGHDMPEAWQRAQGYVMSASRLSGTLELIARYARQRSHIPFQALQARYERLVAEEVGLALKTGRRFLDTVLTAAGSEEGKRTVPRDGNPLAAADDLVRAVEALQDALATEEEMNVGTEGELTIRAYQSRLDEVVAGLALFQSPESVVWVEGKQLWMVPRHPLPLVAPQHIPQSTPILFSSATLEPEYMARMLQLPRHRTSRVGVPFDLASQVLLYRPAVDGDEAVEQARHHLPAVDDGLHRPQAAVGGCHRPLAAGDGELEQVLAVARAMRGRTLVLLNSMAEVERYRQATASAGLPWRLLFEGDADRGAMLEQFRSETDSILLGASFWEGVDAPGETLSCVIIPRLPFPAHDPLIRERRAQAVARGEDPFLAVDLPETLIKVKQGAGRLIRTAEDRGVLALLDLTYRDQPWAERVEELLPQGAEATADLERVARLCR